MTDQRSVARKKSFLAAYASVGAGLGNVFCMVRDLSVGGARLEMDDASQVPDRFELQINGRKRVFQAEVSWRAGTELGVRFVDRHRAARPDLARAS